jgi:hypothetical protein
MNQKAGIMLAGLLLLAFGGCKDKNHFRGAEAAKVITSQAKPFHFLVHVDGYVVDELFRDSDMFNESGFLTLRREKGAPLTTGSAAQQTILRLAKRSGWETASAPTVELRKEELDWLKVTSDTPVLNLKLRRGEDKSGAHFGLRFFVLDEGQTIKVAYELDTN